MHRGYFWIGLENGIVPINVGGVWRTANILGAKQIFTISQRYYKQPSDTCKTWKSVPLVHYADLEDFIDHTPRGAQLVGIERCGRYLSSFVHPEQAVYVLGAEDCGMSRDLRMLCDHVVTIETVNDIPYNVATAASIVMWHRRYG